MEVRSVSETDTEDVASVVTADVRLAASCEAVMLSVLEASVARRRKVVRKWERGGYGGKRGGGVGGGG